ncbi:universal stress protein [Hymenobacter arizonensis]|uniref:Nucleotide-binding universal stress protein, UspA family n=1 Tax=Hymenobacter arizonensis TaxID=1227077 RepID=A0A1I5U462_HYMAR|nr:universal stress protein [Hymenobacter arizonensis]SFP90085.1 Nucleotide-binding universal stress protein, UspA family [Hymenobacter arizonensis]
MKLTLIVLTNFYPAAQQAVSYADALASTLGYDLVLLHVDRAFHMNPYLFPGAARRQPTVAEEEATGAQLMQLAQQLRAATVVEQAPDLQPDVVEDLAKRYQPALFVLGRPTPGSEYSDSINASALQLLRASQFPVLIVPAGSGAPALPKRLLIAADCEEFMLTESAGCVRHLLGNREVEPTVLHVSPVEDDRGCTSALRVVEHSGLLTNLPKARLRGYQHANPAQGILNAAADMKADLVVLPARRRSYFGQLFHRSVTAQVISTSPVPVLVVPAQESSDEHRNHEQKLSEFQLQWPRG